MNIVSRALKFKTNINCSGCVEKVTPFLNEANGIDQWNVDTENKEKILTVHSESIDLNEVIYQVQSAGFNIEFINN
ncbi:MAG TPA: cation transporter [Saprospiraceae bacterium]|nr:cation transporter [Saprospiraceae bacterium]MBK7698316.1 cation transporter [Saprospiraceae bacterium]MBK8827329.1 cation transporter [Saprospiraceae bacterium]HRG40971.1 cation transporter [Saprospiraceae bacterium]